MVKVKIEYEELEKILKEKFNVEEIEWTNEGIEFDKDFEEDDDTFINPIIYPNWELSDIYKEGSISHTCNKETLKIMNPFNNLGDILGRLGHFIHGVALNLLSDGKDKNILVSWDNKYVEIFVDGEKVAKYDR